MEIPAPFLSCSLIRWFPGPIKASPANQRISGGSPTLETLDQRVDSELDKIGCGTGREAEKLGETDGQHRNVDVPVEVARVLKSPFDNREA